MGKPEEAELASILDVPDATVEQKLEALRSAFLEKASALRKSEKKRGRTLITQRTSLAAEGHSWQVRGPGASANL